MKGCTRMENRSMLFAFQISTLHTAYSFLFLFVSLHTKKHNYPKKNKLYPISRLMARLSLYGTNYMYVQSDLVWPWHTYRPPGSRATEPRKLTFNFYSDLNTSVTLTYMLTFPVFRAHTSPLPWFCSFSCFGVVFFLMFLN